MNSPADLLRSKREAQAFDVFLCHNTHDKAQVRQIGSDLKALGILPWLDEWELRPGLSWQDALDQQIRCAKSVAVFVGSEGVGPWQQREVAAFLRKFVSDESPVIPVLLPDAPSEPALPYFLDGMTWVDFRESDPDPMERLVWGITGRHADTEETYTPPRKSKKRRPAPVVAEEPEEEEPEEQEEAVQPTSSSSYSWSPPPIGLAQTLIGSWQVQITNLFGVVSQMMLQIMAGGIFQGQVPTPMGMGTVEGMWQLTPANQLTLQGRSMLGYQTMPYLVVVQLSQTGPYQLAGYTGAGDQTSWQKLS